jgi:hypothetical protein
MKDVNMTCAICGEPRLYEDGWFILLENQWIDRLKILAWNDALASAAGTHLACGAAHVQQLVVHWMTMGSLEFPLADAPGRPKISKFRRVKQIPHRDADLKGTRVVGELAVHRDSLERILQESPESLATILEALTDALTAKDHQKLRNEEDLEDARELCVLSEV